MAYPLKSHLPGGNQLQSKKKRRKPGDDVPVVSTASTKVQGKLVEVNNIVGFGDGTEGEKKQLRTLLSTDDLGIISDCASSETWLSAWDDASPADRFRIAADNLAALLSASILKKFSQPLAQMAPSTKSKLENLVKAQKDLAEAVTNAYLSTEVVEVTDEVAAMFPAHLQTSLPEHQRAKKVAPRPKRTKPKKPKTNPKKGVGQGKGGGRPKGTKMATLHGKILAVPPGMSVVEHMEKLSTPSRGSPIQVGGQGRGESEDAIIRELYDRELRDAKEIQEGHRDKIATLTKKEQVMTNVMGMRNVAWKSAYEQALTIAKVAGLLAKSKAPEFDVGSMIEQINFPTDLTSILNDSAESCE